MHIFFVLIWKCIAHMGFLFLHCLEMNLKASPGKVFFMAELADSCCSLQGSELKCVLEINQLIVKLHINFRIEVDI